MGTAFSAGGLGLVYFPQYQQNFIDLYYLHLFSHFFLAVLDVLLNRTQGSSCLLEKFIRKQRFSFFFYFIFGDMFWAPITFERYHFQSEYDTGIAEL